MAQEEHRSISCSGRWQSAVANGFFQKDDYLQCFCCGLRIGLEMISYDIPTLHSLYSAECSFLKGREPNLKLTFADALNTYCTSPIIDHEVRQPEPLSLQVVRLFEEASGEIMQVLTDEEVINPERVFRLFQIRSNRIFSFAASPPPQRQRNWLIKSGFFWTGSKKVA